MRSLSLAVSVSAQLTELFTFRRLVFISNNNLDGLLPPALFNLTELTLLVFQSNPFLRGSIPDQIGQLTKLQKLYIGRNGLRGTLSASVAKLTKLNLL